MIWMIEYNEKWVMMEMKIGMDTDVSSESMSDLNILSSSLERLDIGFKCSVSITKQHCIEAEFANCAKCWPTVQTIEGHISPVLTHLANWQTLKHYVVKQSLNKINLNVPL